MTTIFDPVDLTLTSSPDEVSDLVADGVELLILDLNAANEVEGLAPESPSARFVTFSEHLAGVGGPNVSNVIIESGDGSYLAGAAAALTSETNIIGFLGGATGIVDNFRAGFEAEP